MIVELNAFGLTKLYNIEFNKDYVEMYWIPKLNPRLVVDELHGVPEFTSHKKVVFEYFGERNEQNIRIYYLTEIK